MNGKGTGRCQAMLAPLGRMMTGVLATEDEGSERLRARLKPLIDALRSVHSPATTDDLADLFARIDFTPEDLPELDLFDPRGCKRTRLLACDAFELVLLGYRPGQFSP